MSLSADQSSQHVVIAVRSLLNADLNLKFATTGVLGKHLLLDVFLLDGIKL